MQRVYLSATQSGVVGLFTKGTLVWTFFDSFEDFRENPQEYCRRLRFEYCPELDSIDIEDVETDRLAFRSSD